MSEFSTFVFDPASRLDKPLLVEASAGTGKTYNIQNAYLRLVLEQGQSVQQILVVTFTDAATRELRERLRTALSQCRDALTAPPADDPPSADRQRARQALALANPDNDPERAKQLQKRIHAALMNFDSAAIFTIHGFCKRVLDRYAFECGHDPDAELSTDQTPLIREGCLDWWRRNIYPKNAHQEEEASPRTGDSVVAAEDPNAHQEEEAFPPFKLADLIKLVTAVIRQPDAVVLGAALPNTPEFQNWVEASVSIKGQIGELRGTISWQDGGKFSKKNGTTADASPLTELIKANGEKYLEWRNTPAAQTELGKAIGETMAIAEQLPTTGDAKPFAQQLATIKKAKNLLENQLYEATLSIVHDIRARIREQSLLTYDAMLVDVRDALRDRQAGPRLQAVLREEFKSALIDEFQDTDPVQYEIFRTLFASGGDDDHHPPLILVGDPKQAIYGFRGGDVFTYYGAKTAIPETDRHTLGENFRSETHLVSAINRLFLDAEGDKTFLNDNVPYATALRAHDVADDKALLVNGKRDEKPFKIWQLSPEQAEQWAALVAEETVRILSDKNQQIAGAPIRPGQIAVLVTKHKEAQAVQQALLAVGVNAVRQATGNLFDSEDAPRLALLMYALLEPNRAAAVRSALGTGLFPCSLGQLARFKAEENAPAETPTAAPAETPVTAPTDDNALPVRFEEWANVFREAGTRWADESFLEAFRFLLHRLKLMENVARHPEGARRLTHLRQLVEMANQASRSMRLGPVALRDWFTRQLEDTNRDDENEESKPRIADDNDAVQIMTVFKSKGLQFPIVFVPTLWNRESVDKYKNDIVLKHHDVKNRLVLNLNTSDKISKETAKRENHEENIRLAYVALTRAIHRVILFEGKNSTDPADITGSASSSRTKRKDPTDPADYAVAHLLSRLPSPNPEEESCANHILRCEAPALKGDRWKGPAVPAPESLQQRSLQNPVDHVHGHTSFSGLVPHHTARKPADNPRDVDGDASARSAPETNDTPEPIFAIPGGAKLGECWHEIFEHIDFEDAKRNPDAIRRMTEQTLDKYRICPEPPDFLSEEHKKELRDRREAVHAMIAHTLQVPLKPDAGSSATSFALRDIPFAQRQSEMEFNFSLRADGGHTLGGLAECLNQYWNSTVRDEEFLAQLATRTSSIPQGFMTGFMDLVFQHEDRFYIVDWKSNRLNGRRNGFDQAGLAAEMRANAYYLQYLIYSVALHGFLARSLKDYDFDRHFGGVFYLFLRGIDGSSSSGVFTDRPSRELVDALSAFLGGYP